VAEVVWTHRALRDLDRIWDYIHQFNPLAAQRMALRLQAAGESLAHFPLRARGKVRYRELVVIRPYIIRYRVVGERVEIITIRHGAQRPDGD
jgi:addiction module RelE/StbE family toxin